MIAVRPVGWLWQSWAYNSFGLFVFVVLLSLILWSVTSRRISYTPSKAPTLLLIASAIIRLIATRLDIDFVGAFALAIDIYAIAKILGLDQREHALSATWLAVLFIFCLPLENLLSRTIGFPLQLTSAFGACQFLSVFYSNLVCNGVEITINSIPVLVDLPCSGSRILIQLSILFTIICAVSSPTLQRSFYGAILTLATAWFANSLRIFIIASGLTFELPMMRAPWHDLLGLGVLATASLPLFYWFKTQPLQPDRKFQPTQSNFVSAHFSIVASFVIIAALGLGIDAKPLDISSQSQVPSLPVVLGNHNRLLLPLSQQERNYFSTWGGNAQRARYGDMTLLHVQTQSPLRHLHSPAECLEGAGHKVEFISSTYSPFPTAIYRTTDPQGYEWRVLVSYFTQDKTFNNVSQAVFDSLVNPGQPWTMIQRVFPWDYPTENFEPHIQRVFNLRETP